MTNKNQVIAAIRGMKDILPDEIYYWHILENTFKSILTGYGYQEIRLPILEKTALFSRSIGEVTDIVEKEMYTFLDRNEESLTLRPEGTAQCVRAMLEHGLIHNQSQKLWYNGPMFRYERPQKGRYRQFYQAGVECFGLPGPEIEAEQLLMMARFFKKLGIEHTVALQLNTLGSFSARIAYQEALVQYFNSRVDDLDEESKRRLVTNPLRILDTKHPDMQELVKAAPSILAYLSTESLNHFEQLQKILKSAELDFTIEPRLVRGLDYYTETVYEWVTQDLGAQGAVCAGGRYDLLVEQLGGKPTPAVGFAIGIERIVALLALKQQAFTMPDMAEVYCLFLSSEAIVKGLPLFEQVRDHIPNIKLVTDLAGGSVKSQFKRADKSGAKLAIILGEDELKNDTFTIKYLREDKPQVTIEQNSLIAFLLGHL
jgi:histidyl-tRNA synthetase